MEYIILFNTRTPEPSFFVNSSGFIEAFSDYESAKEEAETWLKAGDCEGYEIFALCTDEKNIVT